MTDPSAHPPAEDAFGSSVSDASSQPPDGEAVVPTGESMHDGTRSAALAGARDAQTISSLLLHARQLWTAAATCRDNLAHGWVDCHVTVTFEGGRRITIGEAEAYAAQLQARAMSLARDAASGPRWLAKWPTSQALDDLDKNFGNNVKNFIAAMKAAGHEPQVSVTKRPLERQHLMYWAWMIGGNPDLKPPVPPQMNPTLTDPPPMTGVDICWVHYNDRGEIDLAASRAAAQQMVKAAQIVSQPADPRGTGDHAPRHSLGQAIDMAISWTGDLVLPDKTVIPGGTGDPTKDAWNPALIQVAKEKYGLTKGSIKTDWPHWSVDGK